MTASYEKFGLKHVINASGKMTILGVSRVADDVVAAQRFGGQNFFEMADLQRKTGEYIARLLGVEDAHIVCSASAGIAQCVAALIGRGDPFHAHHPYSDRYAVRDIVLPKGHNVDYGAPVEVMVELGGGRVVEAGYANMCSPDHLAVQITDRTAAVLYIKSHHTVQKSMLTVAQAAEAAHAAGVPLLVDAAAEEDLRAYVDAGADLVIYSGAKAIEGPSAGLVIGKHEYVEWVRLQGAGIGRAMKIGKDNILGFTQAIEDYLAKGPEPGSAQRARLEPFVQAVSELPGLTAKIVQDGAGRDIYRASVAVDPAGTVGKTAYDVIAQLKSADPAVYTREYQANNGIIEFDVRAVTSEELGLISERLGQIVGA